MNEEDDPKEEKITEEEVLAVINQVDLNNLIVETGELPDVPDTELKVLLLLSSMQPEVLVLSENLVIFIRYVLAYRKLHNKEIPD